MSHKKEHLESALQRAVQEVIARRLADPRITGLISVTGVSVSPDGSEAILRISVLPEDRQELTLHGLRHAAERIRRDVGDLIVVRRMPRLEFRLDDTLKRQAAALAAIARAQQERETDDADTGAQPPDEEQGT